MSRIVVLVISGLMLAACSGNALFNENFETAETIPDTLRTDGLITGIVEDEDALRLIVDEAFIGSSGWMNIELGEDLGDYSVAARIRVQEGEAQLWGRTNPDACAGYVLSVDPTLSRYRLSVVDENCNLQTLDSEIPLEVPFNRWYEMRLDMQGSTIRGFMDGVEFFNVEDNRYASGSTRLRVVSRSPRAGQVEIDDITIRNN